MDTRSRDSELQTAEARREDDWFLLRRARGGDEQAWERLWLRHRDRLFRVALTITRDRETARDVAHSILLRVLGADAPPREDSLEAYLTTAAWREALRQEERRKRLQPLDGLAETPARDGDEDGERRNHALEALEELPASGPARHAGPEAGGRAQV